MVIEEDRFYRNYAELVSEYARTRHDREKYLQETACDVIAAVCMDERERDFGETMGLPFGTPHLIETAGNKIGQINLGVDRLIFKSMRRAAAEKRRVLLFFVSHSSHGLPETDSCAAWAHDTRRAMLAAEQQVWQFNNVYGTRGDMGIARPLIAMHLHSYTDLESKCWHHGNAKLDPLSLVAESMGRFPVGDSEEFRKTMMEIGLAKLGKLYPFEDPRFTGLTEDDYQAVISQCAEMFAANAVIVREIRGGRREASKGGHQGRRILIGDWPLHTEAGAYFKISDDVPDLATELGIAFKYVLRNKAFARHERGWQPYVPIHVNLEYESKQGQNVTDERLQACAHLTRLISQELTDLLINPHRNQDFWHHLRHAAGDEPLPGLSLEALTANPSRFFRLYPTISSRETKEIAHVSTI